MDRGAWWATYNPRSHKELDTTERLSLHSTALNCHLISLSYLYTCLLGVFFFKKVSSIKAKALYTAVSSAARIVPRTE